MTTITAVKKNNHCAIAADTLSKYGSIKEQAKYVIKNDKIIRVGGNYLGISGPSSFKIILNEYFLHLEETPNFENIESIFNEWIMLHHALRSRYYLRTIEDDSSCFESMGMEVLIANENGIFGVTEHRAVQEFHSFYAYGRGSEFALGAMYAAYDDPSKSAREIAELGVIAAAEFDDSTGMPILSYSIPLIM